MRILILISLMFLLLSCSLERSNPLDPHNSGIEEPARVIVDDLPLVSVGVVRLTWVLQTNIAGYYIYRSMSYDGYYERIATDYPAINDTIGGYDDYDEDLISHNWYYYKVSAFNENGLEGLRSNFVFTNFIDVLSQ
ncbi:MAG: hypothetical protein JXB60_09640 [Candidatus Cloacimonetes bacterium]|nr:hypothetical protein [Candidatus Cloacimonadota bacterium]